MASAVAAQTPMVLGSPSGAERLEVKLLPDQVPQVPTTRLRLSSKPDHVGVVRCPAALDGQLQLKADGVQLPGSRVRRVSEDRQLIVRMLEASHRLVKRRTQRWPDGAGMTRFASLSCRAVCRTSRAASRSSTIDPCNASSRRCCNSAGCGGSPLREVGTLPAATPTRTSVRAFANSLTLPSLLDAVAL